MAKIASLSARVIYDSRGEKTIETRIRLTNGLVAFAAVPQGKSRGSYEAKYVAPEQAVRSIEKKISSALAGRGIEDQLLLDGILKKLDGTDAKTKLGANALLGVSCACARAAALSKSMPLWKHLRSVSGMRSFRRKNGRALRLFVNMINGGLHAGNNLEFQEYLVIPRTQSIREAVAMSMSMYRELKACLIRSYGSGAQNVGDEGGFAPNFKDESEPFAMIQRTARKLGFSKKIDIGLDAAASNVKLSDRALMLFYLKLKKKYNIAYIEDPFGENDFAAFADIMSRIGKEVMIAGDDLTTTNTKRMRMAMEEKSVNSVIIKPNQIGTLSESFDAVREARRYGWSVVVSHRSGETNDDFIADFAYAVHADGFKLGAPARGERIAKYNRLLEIEREAQYA